MTSAAVLALITQLLVSAPEIVTDVEALVKAMKKGANVAPQPPMVPELRLAMDQLLAKLVSDHKVAMMNTMPALAGPQAPIVPKGS